MTLEKRNRCYGLTRTLRWCVREGNWRFFCEEHRLQPWVWSFTALMIVASLITVLTPVGSFVYRQVVSQPETPSASMTYSILRRSVKYAPGAKIHGLDWRPDYEEYRLILRNVSKTGAGVDVRVDLDLIGGIILNSVVHQIGVENLVVSVGEGDLFLGTRSAIHTQIQGHSNNLLMSVARMNPRSRIDLLLVVKIYPGDPDDGFFGLTYFDETPAGRKRKSFSHRILVGENLALRIESEKQLVGSYKRQRMWVHADPVISSPSGPSQ